MIERKLLKIAGILYGIIGVLLLAFPGYGLFLILIGIYFYTQSNETYDDIYNRRVFNYILSALGIINIIGFILIIIVQDNIAKYKRNAMKTGPPTKIIYKDDKETKKIDVLLKLGSFMVVVAGILFATTSWAFISNSLKVIILVLLGILFMGLSFFTEKKLKRYKSSFIYWMVSMSFYLLSIIAILYFGIFGGYLTYLGSGSKLAYAITYLTASGFLLTTYYKFPKKYILYSCYAGIILSLVQLFSYLNLSSMMILTIISFVVMIINLFDQKNNRITIFSKIVSYILFAFIFVSKANSSLETLAACFINFLNFNCFIIDDSNQEDALINVIISNILIIFGLASFAPLGDSVYLVMAIVLTIYNLMVQGNILKTKNFTKKFQYILYCIIMLFILIISLNTELYIFKTCIWIALLSLGMNMIMQYGWFKVDSFRFANFIQPLFVLNAVNAIIHCSSHVIEGIYVIAIITIIYCIMNVLTKNPLDKKITFIYIMVFILIGFCYPVTYSEILASLLLILSSLYLFTICYLKENDNLKDKLKYNISYLILLTSFYLPFVSENILEINIIIPSLLFIMLILMIAPLLKEKWIKNISYIYIILPLLMLIENANITEPVKIILESITGLYIVYLLIKLFIKNDTVRNVIIIIGTLFFLIEPFFLDSIIGAIYVGIIGFILIIYGFRKENANLVFKTGIILTIVNIIYRLKEVWQMIPFWLYLLVGGLSIIGFVTYKEIKKTKTK